jgi:hypothetical protein
MTPDIGATADERSEAARRLIDQAQNDEVVELVTVAALDLCVLGGPRHPLFDETVARAWLGLGNRPRKKLIEWTTDGMVKRGLLTENTPQTSLERDGSTYSLKPELGIVLAARCRPAFIVVTETGGARLRSLNLFALGDQGEPVRGVVAEVPTELPDDIADNFPNAKKLGPLGWFYRYILVSQDKAATILAEWAILPASRQRGVDEKAPNVVTIYRHYDGSGSTGFRLSVRGDGTTAHLDGPGMGDRDPAARYDLDGLRAVMLDLMIEHSR